MGISRRAAEQLISEGRIRVDGALAQLGTKVDPDLARIEADGVPLPASREEKVYVMLNKPVGYVTTMKDEQGRKTVSDLVADVGVRVYPVGRLDLNSEGLLIMTNDGELANMLTHPSFERKKTYRVWARGNTALGLARLAEPMELDGRPLKKPHIRIITDKGDSASFDITIHEGRNRQIRRMCEIAGLTVTRLVRTNEGGVSLGGLEKGKWRRLSESELRLLRGE